MDYMCHYRNLIENAKNRVLEKEQKFEKHHIIPRSLNENKHALLVLNICGYTDIEEITKLLLEEHFIAHLLNSNY